MASTLYVHWVRLADGKTHRIDSLQMLDDERLSVLAGQKVELFKRNAHDISGMAISLPNDHCSTG